MESPIVYKKSDKTVYMEMPPLKKSYMIAHKEKQTL